MAEIPNMTRERAFMLGNLLRQGLCGVKREPVAWLYGGMRLPKLPERSEYVGGGNFFILKMTDLGDTYIYEASMAPCFDTLAGYYKFPVGTKWSNKYYSKTTETWESPIPFTGVVNEHSFYNSYTKLIWSEIDVLDTEGNVKHRASDPVPVGNGMIGFGGVVLPKIPMVDGYDFSYLYYFTGFDGVTRIILNLVQKPFVVSVNEYGDIFWEAKDVKWISFTYNAETNSWGEGSKASGSDRGTEAVTPMIWCSDDMKYEDGTVYLAATDPIPVYE